MKQTPLLAIGDYFPSMYGHLSVKKMVRGNVLEGFSK
jgi:hypothetical protein